MILSLTVLISCTRNVSQKNLKRGGTYIDSPDLIKNEKTISINNDDKCLQYVATDA